MEISNDTQVILGTLRTQAWERAKGELQAVISTYYNSTAFRDYAERRVSQDQLEKTINAFVKKVEVNCLLVQG